MFRPSFPKVVARHAPTEQQERRDGRAVGRFSETVAFLGCEGFLVSGLQPRLKRLQSADPQRSVFELCLC